MHVELANVTWVGNIDTREDKRTGVLSYYRDFVARWLDSQSGQYCSMKFTVKNNMQIINQIKVGLLVKFDFTTEARPWNGRYFNNTKILSGSLHCVPKKK